MQGSVKRAIFALGAAAAIAVLAPAGAHAQGGVWSPVGSPPATSASGAPAEIKADAVRAFRLDKPELKADLGTAPRSGLKSRSAAASSKTVISLPAPDGGYQRFAVEEAPIMEAGLAARHPEIKTYAGVGLDDPSATVRADTTPLGFHASVRSPDGAWYVDPYYHLDDSVYVSYYGRDLENAHGEFAERGPEGETDPLDIGAKALAGPAIQLRTYRLALVTDPSYATYFGGPANVTAAKVTLMNRVDQVYEDETAIRLVLIDGTDKLNLDTPALATDANGPCGSAACYTTSQLSTCGSGLLSRNRIVIGQIIGASNYDIGHIALGKSGGGVASLGVVGGLNKAQGCTGVPTPVGDYYAVDYVAHEMGHQFAGNHTFNGTQSNCSGGNRSAATSVEPGSGSSIMAYAGICQQDNLQPHSDPYWSQRSFDEITAYTSSSRPNINETQTISLRDFDGSDSLTLKSGQLTAGPFVRGANYTALDIQGTVQGSEIQNVALTGYDANGDAYTLSYKGAATAPIVRGQNDTAAGIQNALQGGNEQQQVTLGSFNGTSQSFRISLGGNTSTVLGAGGAAVSNANVAAAINAIPGFAGGAAVANAGNGGFTVTFAGASAATDVPALAIVNCTDACTSAVRELAKGGTGVSTWPAGATVTAGAPADSGYRLLFAGTLQNKDVDALTVGGGTGGTAGTVAESLKGGAGIFPPGTTASVAPFAGAGSVFDETGFQITFGGTLGGVDLPPVTLAVTGGSGFVGETARGGAIQNQGYFLTPTGNHAPDVTVPAALTIPTRTPFTLTGSATDPDGDTVTYMWEQNDRGAAAGTALVNNTKANGPLFRQFGKYANVTADGTLQSPSPGENGVDRNPTRVFPDMDQILADNTNAATGRCPAAPPAPTAVPVATVDCFSEFLPTADWTGFLSDRTMTFRLTARDGRLGGGGIGSAETKVAVAPLAGPFRVTSQSIPQSLYGTSPQTITWDVNGTDVAPVNAANVRITLSTDGGATFPYVLAASTPNDGSAGVIVPNLVSDHARIKIEAVGNVFFDVNHADLKIVAPPTVPVGGTVPATLTLSLGASQSFGPFAAGIAKDYDTTIAATVVSTAGDAALSVSDQSSNAPGHLVNGAFSLPSALQAKANAGAYSSVGASPATLLTYTAPISNDSVAIGVRQHIGDTDALRTGSYSKTLTFTLSTTSP
ncbi:M12 family metallo-peptidase [Candidatus Solirubrobacter pratensis]|uniref:M12 family metallo-peptidase n=1 Tax=Candidatus Solirubrobacter pratensis TaxID=1298857 RepID=UPI0004027541|nr:M12 family metallo-peptidase [Candidatus Solirubrobacter pratensis]